MAIVQTYKGVYSSATTYNKGDIVSYPSLSDRKYRVKTTTSKGNNPLNADNSINARYWDISNVEVGQSNIDQFNQVIDAVNENLNTSIITTDKVDTNISDNATFKTQITNQQNTFENTINTKQTNFETSINNKQSTFETNITNKQNTYESTVNAKIVTIENTANLANTKSDNAVTTSDLANTKSDNAVTTSDLANTKSDNALSNSNIAKTDSSKALSIVDNLTAEATSVLTPSTAWVDTLPDGNKVIKLQIQQGKDGEMLSVGSYVKSVKKEQWIKDGALFKLEVPPSEHQLGGAMNLFAFTTVNSDPDTNGMIFDKYDNHLGNFIFTSNIAWDGFITICGGVAEGFDATARSQVVEAISQLNAHINDNVKHITATERTNWDNKVPIQVSQSQLNNRKIYSNATTGTGTGLVTATNEPNAYTIVWRNENGDFKAKAVEVTKLTASTEVRAPNLKSVTYLEGDSALITGISTLDFDDNTGVHIGTPNYAFNLPQKSGTFALTNDIPDAELKSNKGIANGYASLDSVGKVPTSQLPSYVDDVLEYPNKASFPATGESGKIYVDITTNLAWRWGGTVYTEVSPSLALGETSSTAFVGDKGKEAYDKAHTHSNKTILDATTASFLTADKTKLDGIASGAEVNVQSDWNISDTNSDAYIKNKPALSTVATSGSYNDLSNKPTIPSVANLVTTDTTQIITGQKNFNTAVNVKQELNVGELVLTGNISGTDTTYLALDPTWNACYFETEIDSGRTRFKGVLDVGNLLVNGQPISGETLKTTIMNSIYTETSTSTTARVIPAISGISTWANLLNIPIRIKANANGSTSGTLNIGSLGAKTLYMATSYHGITTSFQTPHWIRTGNIYIVMWDGSYLRIIDVEQYSVLAHRSIVSDRATSADNFGSLGTTTNQGGYAQLYDNNSSVRLIGFSGSDIQLGAPRDGGFTRPYSVVFQSDNLFWEDSGRNRYKIYHEGNLSGGGGSYLPLSGGTMSGVITTPNNTVGIIIGDDVKLCDRNLSNTLVLEGNQNSDRGYIKFGSNGIAIGSHGTNELAIDNGQTQTSANNNNLAINIGNTQGIGGYNGALKFWNITSTPSYMEIQGSRPSGYDMPLMTGVRISFPYGSFTSSASAWYGSQSTNDTYVGRWHQTLLSSSAGIKVTTGRLTSSSSLTISCPYLTGVVAIIPFMNQSGDSQTQRYYLSNVVITYGNSSLPSAGAVTVTCGNNTGQVVYVTVIYY